MISDIRGCTLLDVCEVSNDFFIVCSFKIASSVLSSLSLSLDARFTSLGVKNDSFKLTLFVSFGVFRWCPKSSEGPIATEKKKKNQHLSVVLHGDIITINPCAA